ncbi:glycosyltransferase WbsX family protein [Oleiharenicola lentus]|uniref:glycosyltransferase WbsX family protein n=1 Tax=Oleiharenicola lentus TaxID=2508720 RepID=UPI003F66B502
MNAPAYQVGVYYFPGYHHDPLVSQWHGRTWTEWNLLKTATPRFAGHQQPKIPLWGYEDEALPGVMRRKAEAAAAHGISHFIFDWYYYENGPFLNRCLDEGYLGIQPAPAVKFALMWANHDWLNIQPARLDGNNPVMLKGTVDRVQFDAIALHVIERYFQSPHYWRIDGCPYFSFYDLPNLIKGLGGIAETADALNCFRRLAVSAGLPGLHLNLVHWQNKIVGSDEQVADPEATLGQLGFDSISSYVWIHHTQQLDFPQTEYAEVLRQNTAYWEKTAATYPMPYFPNVSMGWDASPRTVQTDAFENRGYPFMATIANNTPAAFAEALKLAKAHLDRQELPVKHLSINAWNEWTEGSYLEPDTVHGYAYLKAIRDVFGAPQARL